MIPGIKDYLIVLNSLTNCEEDVFPKAYHDFVRQNKGWWRTYDARAAHPSSVDDDHLLNAARAFLKRYDSEQAEAEMVWSWKQCELLAGMLPIDERMLFAEEMSFERYLAFAAFSQPIWILMTYEIRKRRLEIPDTHAIIRAFIAPPRIEWYRDVLRWLQEEIARAESKKQPNLSVNVKFVKRSKDDV